MTEVGKKKKIRKESREEEGEEREREVNSEREIETPPSRQLAGGKQVWA